MDKWTIQLNPHTQKLFSKCNTAARLGETESQRINRSIIANLLATIFKYSAILNIFSISSLLAAGKPYGTLFFSAVNIIYKYSIPNGINLTQWLAFISCLVGPIYFAKGIPSEIETIKP